MRSPAGVIALVTLSLVLATGSIRAQAPPAPGSIAPDFQLQGATSDSILSRETRLSDLTPRGTVILAFYPADWSGGCTNALSSIYHSVTR